MQARSCDLFELRFSSWCGSLARSVRQVQPAAPLLPNHFLKSHGAPLQPALSCVSTSRARTQWQAQARCGSELAPLNQLAITNSL